MALERACQHAMHLQRRELFAQKTEDICDVDIARPHYHHGDPHGTRLCRSPPCTSTERRTFSCALGLRERLEPGLRDFHGGVVAGPEPAQVVRVLRDLETSPLEAGLNVAL